jgi:hypothetical protein
MTRPNPKERKSDRILVIKPIDGKTPLSSTGLLDPRIFTGEGNNLHATMDTSNCIWYFKYENGGLPNELKQRFTSFNKLMDFAEIYFNKRNLKIVEVIDYNA